MIRIPAILLFTLFIATGTKNSYAQKVFATFHIQLTGTGGKPMKNAFVKIVGEDTTMEAAGEDGQFSFPPLVGVPPWQVFTPWLVFSSTNHMS